MSKLYGPDGQIIKRGANLDPGFWARAKSRASGEADAVAQQPYAKHPVVFACCNAIMMNLAQLPRVLYNKSTPDKPIVEHEWLNLLQNPNPLMNGSTFWQMTILHLLLPTKNTLGGQCFWIPVDGRGENFDFTSGGVPMQLYPFNDSMIKPIFAKGSDELVGWKLSLPNGKELDYGLNEIIRFSLPNPYDYTRGMSPLSAAQIAIKQDAKANDLNNRFYDNNASLGGVLMTDNPISTEAAKELIDGWREEYSGADKNGKIALLHSGLKYQQFERTHVDMQFMEQKSFNREEIMMVYRVPKAELSLYEDVNYATALSADKSFWKKTLLPYDKMIWETLNSRWLNYYKNGSLRGKSDLSVVEALQEDFKDKIAQMKEMYAMAIPVEESARMLKVPLDVSKYPWLQTALVTSTLIDVAQLSDLNDIKAESIKAGKAPADDKEPPTPEKEDEKPKSLDDKFNLIMKGMEATTEQQKAWLNSYLERVLDPSENDLKKTLNKYFVRQRNAVQDKVDAWAKGKAKKSFDVDATEFFLDLDEEADILKAVSKPIFEKQIKAQADEMAEELGHGLQSWEIDSETTQAIKAKRLKDITKINTTTFNVAGKKIGKILKEADPDITVGELAKRIKRGISEVYSIRISQARTIARTEIGILSSSIRTDIMAQEGIEKHTWLAVEDDHTRVEHLEDNGETVKIGEAFPNTGLLFPLEPDGEADQIINCRCTTIPVVE